jgi:hypothetical protein
MKLPPEVLKEFKKAGAKGGKRSGKRLTAKQREEKARKAANARWERREK